MTGLPPVLPLGLAGFATLLAVAALIVAVRATRRLTRLRARYNALMTGVDGADLAVALESYVQRVASAEARVERLEQRANQFDGRLARTVSRVRLLRYRAFEDAGGDQSFALALLDEASNGAVVSGLYGRGGMRVFAKPVQAGTSTYNLTAEEVQAIAEAANGA